MKLSDYLQPPRADDYLTDLFTRWTRIDPARNAQAIVAVATKLTDTNQESQLAKLLQISLQSWWTTSAIEAENWQQSLSRDARGERVAFAALIQVVSQADPLHAFSLIANRAGTSKAHYATLADGFAQGGIDFTKQLLTRLPETSPPQATSTLNNTAHF